MTNSDEDVVRFRRFLAIGSESIYRVGIGGRRGVDMQPNIGIPSSLQRLLADGRGEEAVKEVTACRSMSNIGSAPSLLALAVCARSTCTQTKKAAHTAVNQVCKTPAQLFSFIQYAKNTTETRKGWGRALRRTVSNWYNTKDAMTLAVLTTRYKSSSGWTHRDVLRLSHTKPKNPGIGVVVKYLLRGISAARETQSADTEALLQYLEAVDTVKHSSDDHHVAVITRQYAISKEHIPTKLLNSLEVWSALIEQMTGNEVLMNFGKIASLNLLDASCATTQTIINKLQDEQAITIDRVSPVLVLIALRTYEQGKGKGKWSRNEQVVAALNSTLSTTISKNAIGSGKRVLIGVKISSNLHQSSVRGTVALSPMIAVAGLVQILLHTQADCHLVYFLSDVTSLSVTKKMTLSEICKEIGKASVPLPPQLCQCDMTSPIRWAEENKHHFDVIVILTDSKESTGEMTTAKALEKYCQALHVQTRLVICGLTASQLDHADPRDLSTLDIAGFDTSVPDILSHFMSGHI